jgi:recombination DNA repair RAD52 pathway protein
MPTLIAYLLAVALLLVGGIEALSWLTTPEPSRVATRAVTRPLHPLPKIAETKIAETEDATSRSQIEAGVDENTERATPQTMQDRAPQLMQDAPPDAELKTVTTDPHRENKAKDRLQRRAEFQPENRRPVSSEVPASMHAERPAARTRHTADKPKYVMMTLRTIELPDGRRLQRLIPFHGGGRYLAYLPEQ